MNKKLKNVGVWLGRIAVLGVCGLLSIFLMASGYEAIYNKSLPFVHTVDAVNLKSFAEVYDLKTAAEKNEKLYGNFGKPMTLKLPERSSRLNIAQPIVETNDRALARATSLHLLTPAEPRSGNMGIALLYCRVGYPTIVADKLPQSGANIFMDTDKNWRYVYKVANTSVIPDNQRYILADNGKTAKLLIVCNDEATHTNIVVEATLLSVQGIDQ